MMSGPDPYGSGGYYDTVYADQYFYPNYQDDSPSWWDLAQQAISQGAQTAQIIGAGYPPGSTIVYAPQYPGGPIVPTVQAPPPSGQYPMPLPGPVVSTPAPGGGVQLSNTTLMLLVGGVLLFMLGGKRGR